MNVKIRREIKNICECRVQGEQDEREARGDLSIVYSGTSERDLKYEAEEIGKGKEVRDILRQSNSA